MQICSYGIGTVNGGSISDSPPLKITRLDVTSFKDMESKYPAFFHDFLVKNQPCLITAPEVIKSWPAMKHWVTPDRQIDFDFLQEKYGNVEIEVTEIKKGMSMEYGGMSSETMKLREYLDYLKDYSKQAYPPSMSCLYLKDWHILRNCGNKDESHYTPLKFFESDWLNEICELDKTDDFRFVYLGPKGSWTPLHADVYGSFSWSVNIVGQKKWRLYPPGKENIFRNLVYDKDNAGVEGRDFMEVTQEAGETIFVPSGWHHIVWNEKDTLSINHNWFNATNLCYVWHQLQDALELVKKEIEDLKDQEEFGEQCQLILKANHGMDYKDFVRLITKIWKMRDAVQMRDEQDHLDLSVIKHLVEDHLATDPDLLEEHKIELAKMISKFPL